MGWMPCCFFVVAALRKALERCGEVFEIVGGFLKQVAKLSKAWLGPKKLLKNVTMLLKGVNKLSNWKRSEIVCGNRIKGCENCVWCCDFEKVKNKKVGPKSSKLYQTSFSTLFKSI